MIYKNNYGFEINRNPFFIAFHYFSGIDIVGLLQRFEFVSSSLNKSAIGASNFVIAYAVHKIFAPVRISLTLASAPFIVRYMRSKGFLKT